VVAGNDGGVIISLRVHNLTEDELELFCHQAGSIPYGGLDLHDEIGAKWYVRGQYFDFGSGRMLITPGQPGLTAAKYFPPPDAAGDGLRFDLGGVCIATVRGRENRFPIILAGLAPKR
jgi:hypothetical protein